MQEIRTEAGKQEIFHKRERQKREKSTGMAGKNTAGGIRKIQKIPDEKSG